MIRWLAVLLLVVAPLAASAQPVAIQTGEHATFSRVVLTIPPGADWRLGRNETGYVLRLPVTDGYDTSRFYDLIPRTRISDIAQDRQNGILFLQVSCPCNADAFLYRPNLLVIDIRDGAPSAESAFEMVLDEPDIAVPADPSLAVASVPFTVPQQRLLPLIPSMQIGSPQGIAMPAPDTPMPTSGSSTVEVTMAEEGPPPPSTLDDDLAALEQAITESLARGLSQGLLEPDLQDADAGPQTDEALLSALGLDGALAPGLRTTTSVDRAAIPPDPAVAVTQSGDACLPDQYFDVGGWGDDRPYAVQIGEARAALTGEFDRLDEQAVLALAQRFVFFGFGREAVQTLKLDGVTSLERRYLAAIAQIIDGDPLASGLFDQQVSCASPVALWAMLARREGAQDAQIDRPSVLRAFKGLPVALQKHLSPLVADRFLAVGDTDGAMQVLSVIGSEPAPTVDATLAQASLTRVLGEPAQATETLAEMAETNPRMTPEAMIRFLTEAVADDVPLDEDDFTLADAFRFENAELPIAGDLAVAQVRAFVHGDRFGEARRLLRDEDAAIGPDRLLILKDELAVAATGRMDTGDFLRFAFDETHQPVSATTQNAMARRLLDVGFPDAAMAMTATPIDGEDGVARQYLRAEASLALADAAGAIAEIAELETARADALRRVAADLQNADVLVPDMTVAEATETTLWRRGDWRDLVQSDDPLLRAASTAMLEQQSASLDPATPLASGREMLSSAAQAREVVDGLLDRFAAPEEF